MERMIISFLEADTLYTPKQSERVKNGKIHIKKYFRKSGTAVRAHWRRVPIPEEKTVYEIAVELEEKYHVVSKFIERYRDDITLKIAKERFKAEFKEGYNADLEIAEYIQGLWLDFINNEEYTAMTGFISKRAQKEDGKTFYHTGAYSDYMVIKVNDTYSRGDF